MKSKLVLPFFLGLILFNSMTAQIDLKPNSSTFSGKVNINNTLYNNGMQFPAADGLPGQMLTTDGQGLLNWQNPPAERGNLEAIYGSLCSTPDTFLISSHSISYDTCGIIYDSGGPVGNYGNDESEYFTINMNSTIYYDEPQTLIRLIIQSLNIEDGQDTLYVENLPYTTSLNAPDTLYFGLASFTSIVKIHFVSDGNNPGGPYGGFEIFWEAIQPNGQNLNNTIPGDFKYDPNRQSAYGGFQHTEAQITLGERSLLLGFGGTASGGRSTSIGVQNDAIGERSSAVGYSNEATASFSSAFGYNNEANANNSSAFGYGTKSNIYQMTAIGTYNHTVSGSTDSWVSTDPVFMVGNGRYDARSTAMTILKNGNTGIGTTGHTSKLEVLGGTGPIIQITPLVNNWDLTSGDGDFRIGNNSYHLEMSMSIGGAGSGHARIQADGGLGRITLGGNDTDILEIDDNGWINVLGSIYQNGSLIHSDRRFKKKCSPH